MYEPRVREFDAVVVGASIAGCTAAVLYGRLGLRVALLERHADAAAYKTICTHFIQPSAAATIARLELDETLEQVGGIRNGIELWTRWGWIRRPAGAPPEHGWSIRREKLDPLLRRLAAATPGVELRLGSTARRLLPEGGVEVETRDGSVHEYRAPLVVGADGRDSRVAGWARIEAAQKPNGRFGYFAYYRGLPLATGAVSQAWFLEPDVACAFPNDDELTLLAAMPAKASLPEWHDDREGAFERFWAAVPEGPAIAAATRVSPILGVVDLPNRTRRAAAPGVALVGDAAMGSDPLWGVGCGFALQSAEWLVEETAGALAAGAGLDAALRRYARLHRRRLGGHQFLISDFSRVRGWSAVERLLYAAAARDGRSATHLSSFGARTIGVREFLAPRALVRAARVNLRHRLAPA